MKGITLFLMSKKGLFVLKSIIENSYASIIDQVVIGTDLSVQNDFSSEMASLCERNKIKYAYKDDHKAILSSYSIAVSWRWLIREKQTKLIVLHDSMLPKYRGFSPLVSQLINGENKIGVTAIFAADEYDTGDIIDQLSVEVSYPMKISAAIDLISPLYAEITNRIIKNLISGKEIKGLPQNDEEATYSVWRDEEDYRINWDNDAELIKRTIDASGFPYKGTYACYDNTKIRILDAQVQKDRMIENRSPGKVLYTLEDYPVVICGKGLLLITEARHEDGRAVEFPIKKFRIRFY